MIVNGFSNFLTSLSLWRLWWLMSPLTTPSYSKIMGCQLIIASNQPHMEKEIDVSIFFKFLQHTIVLFSHLGLTTHFQFIRTRAKFISSLCPHPLGCPGRFSNDSLVQGDILPKVVPSYSSRHLVSVYCPANLPPSKIHPLFCRRKMKILQLSEICGSTVTYKKWNALSILCAAQQYVTS